MPGRVICRAIVVSLALLARAALAQDVTVEGNRFLRDGEPWVAEGVNLVGRIAPEKRMARKPPYAAAREAFGPEMLAEVRRYGADVVRLQVSQGALDPKSRRHDPHYTAEVLDAIAETRAAGYNVILAMEWTGTAGPADSEGLPTVSTRRAWRVLVDEFGGDRGILLELINEPPDNPRTPADWKPWQETMQETIDALRKRGSMNVLLAPGMRFSRFLDGAPPLDDPLGQLGYAIHPYLGPHNQTRAQWDRNWGDFARTHPVIATEFNAHAGGSYCRPGLEAQAEEILAYLREKQIGVVAWALDMPNLREPDGSYTTFDVLICAQRRDGGVGGAGQMIHEYFQAN